MGGESSCIRVNFVQLFHYCLVMECAGFVADFCVMFCEDISVFFGTQDVDAFSE